MHQADIAFDQVSSKIDHNGTCTFGMRIRLVATGHSIVQGDPLLNDENVAGKFAHAPRAARTPQNGVHGAHLVWSLCEAQGHVACTGAQGSTALRSKFKVRHAFQSAQVCCLVWVVSLVFFKFQSTPTGLTFFSFGSSLQTVSSHLGIQLP